MSTFPLTITKLDSAIHSGEVESLTAPGVEGELTVLKNHVPLVTSLRSGVITIKNGEGVQTFDVEKGILEVSKSGTTVLL